MKEKHSSLSKGEETRMGKAVMPHKGHRTVFHLDYLLIVKRRDDEKKGGETEVGCFFFLSAETSVFEMQTEKDRGEWQSTHAYTQTDALLGSNGEKGIEWMWGRGEEIAFLIGQKNKRP